MELKTSKNKIIVIACFTRESFSHKHPAKIEKYLMCVPIIHNIIKLVIDCIIGFANFELNEMK